MKMMHAAAMMGIMGLVGASASTAHAGLCVTFDPGIYAPYDNAQAEVIWIGSQSAIPGMLQWIDPSLPAAELDLWNNSAPSGESSILPRLFDEGERIDFRYEILGGLDALATDIEGDWPQFDVDDTDPLNIIVALSDVRSEECAKDYDSAVFRVVFTRPDVPAPGALALLGFGGMLGTKRRR